MRALVRKACGTLFEMWMYLQVELHGNYSVSRMRLLKKYSKSTSILRASVVTVISPFPCLIILILIDCVPLAPTEKGSQANYLFWGRNFLTITLMTRAILEQLHLSIPTLDLTSMRAIMMSLISSAGAVAFMLLMTDRIGFPLPFTLVVGIPIWFVGLVVCFGICFGSKMKEEQSLRNELLNYIVVIACQVVLTFIYPLYLYGFRSISSTAQTFYVLLLPVIKIATKNWISFFLGTKDDLKPQVVILNIEVFNALYVASSMQNATSISTTMALTFVDFVLAWISINDVNQFLVGISRLLRKIPVGHPLKTADFVDVALQILEDDAILRESLSLRSFTCRLPEAIVDQPPKVHDSIGSGTREVEGTSRQLFASASTANASLDSFVSTAAAVAPYIQPESRALRRIFTAKERREYVQRTAQVLFTTEFIILIEFTEVIIPFIYSECLPEFVGYLISGSNCLLANAFRHVCDLHVSASQLGLLPTNSLTRRHRAGKNDRQCRRLRSDGALVIHCDEYHTQKKASDIIVAPVSLRAGSRMENGSIEFVPLDLLHDPELVRSQRWVIDKLAQQYL